MLVYFSFNWIGNSLKVGTIFSLPVDFPGDSDRKKSVSNTEHSCLTPGLGRSPGEKNGYALQYSCLENLMDRGPWWVTKSQTHLSD